MLLLFFVIVVALFDTGATASASVPGRGALDTTLSLGLSCERNTETRNKTKNKNKTETKPKPKISETHHDENEM